MPDARESGRFAFLEPGRSDIARSLDEAPMVLARP
jgi:hypothetical protein